MMIEHPIQTTCAYLIWQSPLGGDGSRSRKRVAILRDTSGDVSFEYLIGTSDFDDALSEGFDGYTGIPLDREDNSDAIHTLIRRLPSPSRPDFVDFLKRYGLSTDMGLTDLSLLAYTGAKLTSDSYSVAESFEGFDRSFQYLFDVAGRRHTIKMVPDVKIGDKVQFRPEPTNEADSNAIEMVNTSGDRLGYVNASQAEKVGEWISEGSISGKVFRINGREDYPRLFVMANIIPKSVSEAA